MWYKKNVTATISGSQTDKFPVVGQPLETTPAGIAVTSRSYRGIVVWRPLLRESQLQTAPTGESWSGDHSCGNRSYKLLLPGNRGLETTPTGIATTSRSYWGIVVWRPLLQESQLQTAPTGGSWSGDHSCGNRSYKLLLRGSMGFELKNNQPSGFFRFTIVFLFFIR